MPAFFSQRSHYTKNMLLSLFTEGFGSPLVYEGQPILFLYTEGEHRNEMSSLHAMICCIINDKLQWDGHCIFECDNPTAENYQAFRRWIGNDMPVIGESIRTSLKRLAIWQNSVDPNHLFQFSRCIDIADIFKDDVSFSAFDDYFADNAVPAPPAYSRYSLENMIGYYNSFNQSQTLLQSARTRLLVYKDIINITVPHILQTEKAESSHSKTHVEIGDIYYSNSKTYGKRPEMQGIWCNTSKGTLWYDIPYQYWMSSDDHMTYDAFRNIDFDTLESDVSVRCDNVSWSMLRYMSEAKFDNAFRSK